MGEIAAISFASSIGNKWKEKFFKKQDWQRYGVADSKSRRPLSKNQMAIKPATYSSRISTDVPLYEIPGASFDRYLEDKPRVFKAMFPDKRRSQRLNETRWKLEGLDNVLEPSHFSLGVKGLLYADSLEARTRLKGQLEMNISFVLPPVLALLPEDVRRNVAESVLTRLVQDMKHKVNSSLLADYSEFKRGQPKNMV